jgi:hypothetical protein
VNHDQNTVFAHTANGMPALFAVLDTIEDDGPMRVREDELREREIKAMLGDGFASLRPDPSCIAFSSCLVLTVKDDILCTKSQIQN